MNVKVDVAKKLLYVKHTLIYNNISNDTLKHIVLNDWNNAFSSKSSPLAKRFSDEFSRAFHLAKEIMGFLKEKLEELKKTSSEKQKVALQKIIDDLKLRQRVIRLKVDKQVHNLKKAFPSVQSEHIKEYLKLKVTELKNKTKE